MANPERELSDGETAALDAVLSDMQAEQEAPPPIEDDEAAEPGADEAPHEDEEEPEAESEQEEPRYTVKIDGKSVEVPLSELQKGYSRNRDYTRKTEEVAELRRQAEAERQAAQADRQRYLQGIEQAVHQARQLDPIIAEGQKTDWAAEADKDPAGTQAKWFRYQQRIAQLQYMEHQRQGEILRQSQDQEKREESALLEAIPEWRDQDKGRQSITEIRQSLVKNYGYKMEELKFADHRYVLVARDAMRYRNSQTARKAAEQKRTVQNRAPTLVPGSASAGGRDKASTALRQRAIRTNSASDVADYAVRLLAQGD